MEFRPCIDIHNGKVKQIVGKTLTDQGDKASANFVSGREASYFADLYQKKGWKGGHVIMLNPPDSEYYQDTKEQALDALSVYPGGLQIGGSITAANAPSFIEAGASHVIVTSYVFQDGMVHKEHLKALMEAVGKEKVVLDLSCKKKDGHYYIVTNRWQKYTQVYLSKETLDELSAYCDEFLVHAVDVEGQSQGMDMELLELLAQWNQIPITYAGGIHSVQDIELLRQYGNGKIHYTIGSALDLFGGSLALHDVEEYMKKWQR